MSDAEYLAAVATALDHPLLVAKAGSLGLVTRPLDPVVCIGEPPAEFLVAFLAAAEAGEQAPLVSRREGDATEALVLIRREEIALDSIFPAVTVRVNLDDPQNPDVQLLALDGTLIEIPPDALKQEALAPATFAVASSGRTRRDCEFDTSCFGRSGIASCGGCAFGLYAAMAASGSGKGASVIAMFLGCEPCLVKVEECGVGTSQRCATPDCRAGTCTGREVGNRGEIRLNCIANRGAGAADCDDGNDRDCFYGTCDPNNKDAEDDGCIRNQPLPPGDPIGGECDESPPDGTVCTRGTCDGAGHCVPTVDVSARACEPDAVRCTQDRCFLGACGHFVDSFACTFPPDVCTAPRGCDEECIDMHCDSERGCVGTAKSFVTSCDLGRGVCIDGCCTTRGSRGCEDSDPTL